MDKSRPYKGTADFGPAYGDTMGNGNINFIWQKQAIILWNSRRRYPILTLYSVNVFFLLLCYYKLTFKPN